MFKTIAIIGPTASGKTDLAIKIYEKLSNFIIVNCDSRQFWSLDHLSCAPSEQQKSIAPHVLFNCLDNSLLPNLGWWSQQIKTIPNKILVGGNGFYIKNLQKGIPEVTISEKTRNYVANLSNQYEQLLTICPQTKIMPNDKYRTTRYLEFFFETGYNFDNFPNKYQEDLYILYLKPNLETLKKNIQLRTESFIDLAISEVNQTIYHKNLETIIGYQEILQYLDGKIEKNNLITLINLRTFQYAKHQMKFFKTINCNQICSTNSELNFQHLLNWLNNNY